MMAGACMGQFIHELRTEKMSKIYVGKTAAEAYNRMQTDLYNDLAGRFDFASPVRNPPSEPFKDEVSANVNKPEYTGGSVSYYRVKVAKPTSKDLPAYEAECNDIIEALQMNYAEGNAFKAIWRKCAAQLGKAKAGYKDGLYDSEKVEFFGGRMVAQNKAAA